MRIERLDASMLPKSLSELIGLLPGLPEDFSSRVHSKTPQFDLTSDWHGVWAGAPAAAREMLTAAALLASEFSIPDTQLAAPLRELRDALE